MTLPTSHLWIIPAVSEKSHFSYKDEPNERRVDGVKEISEEGTERFTVIKSRQCNFAFVQLTSCWRVGGTQRLN